MLDAHQAEEEVIDGGHRIWSEEGDVVVLVLCETVTEAGMRQMAKRFIAEGKCRDYVLFLVDLNQLKSFDPAARKVGAQVGAQLPKRAVALFGGSFGTRVVMDLLFRASNLLGAKGRALRYFADEETARSWLASMRSKLK